MSGKVGGAAGIVAVGAQVSPAPLPLAAKPTAPGFPASVAPPVAAPARAGSAAPRGGPPGGFAGSSFRSPPNAATTATPRPQTLIIPRVSRPKTGPRSRNVTITAPITSD